MKHILLIITTVLILCVSCRGKGSASASSNSRHDSIAAIDDNRSFEFLKTAVLWGMAKGTSISPVSMVR